MIRESHLYREIHEQPQALGRLLEQEPGDIERLAEALSKSGISQVVIAARGTSDNAARYAQYVLGAMNGLTVALATPSLFSIYRKPPRLKDALVLGISQSGKSPDIVAVLAEARRQGALTAAITNRPDSDLAQQADHVIELHAGEERSVAATKTYTSELAVIALLSAELAEDAGRQSALRKVPALVAEALATSKEAALAAARWREADRCVVIGRGYNYATAFELALKLKELTYSVAEPYSSADFRHGPLAMIQPGFPVILIAASGAMLEEMKELARDVRQLGAELIVIGDDKGILDSAEVGLRLPQGIPEWLSPLVAIVPGQLLAMHLAAVRGIDLDRPRALRKVTETR
jgi:glucosamine--fructose-6-phosphate aminotransferase (isomerizing)